MDDGGLIEPEPPRPLWRELLFWGLLVSPGLILLSVRYVPFQDYLGHIGVNGVLAHARSEPIGPFYSLRPWVGPNRLFYGLSAPLLPLGGRLASQIVLATAAAGLAPAAWLLMRQAGRSGRAALWVPPFAFGHVMASGFAPNVLAYPLMLLAFAAAAASVQAPSRARTLGLVVMSALATTAHLFIGLATAGLLMGAALLFGATRRKRPAAALFAGGSAAAVVAAWTSPGGGGGALAALGLLQLQAPGELLHRLRTWSYAFSRTDPTDDLALGLTALAVLAGVVLAAAGVGTGGPLSRRGWRAERTLLAFFTLGLAGAFAVIPMNLGPPVNWWGAGVRLVLPLCVLLIALVDPSELQLRRAPRRWRTVLGIGTLATVVQLVDLGIELHRFDRETMAGFDRVVELVESRTPVCALHAPDARETEFPGDALWYASNLVLAEKLVPTEANLFGNPGVLVARQSEPPHATYGRLRHFPWREAASHCPQLLIAGTIDASTERRLEAFGYGSVSFGNWTLATR